MGGLSFWHILIVILVVVLLFGAGKIPRLMKDLGTGIKAFKGGMKDENDPEKAETPPAQPGPVVQTAPPPQPQIIQPSPQPQTQTIVRDANDNVAAPPPRKSATRKKQTKA